MQSGVREAWKPGLRRTGIGMAVFALAWLWLSNRIVLAPPTDNIEQLIWVRSLEWGYYKHPPLPTWLLWPVVRLLGWNAWATYVLGATCTLGRSRCYGTCCAACAARPMPRRPRWLACASRSTTAGCTSTTTRSS
ncbi:hypothetical protein WJ977_19460 [Achromobacter xylosoxidans]